MGSRWWPGIVLATVAASLALWYHGLVRGVLLVPVVTVEVLLGIGMWWTVDAALPRRGGKALALGLVVVGAIAANRLARLVVLRGLHLTNGDASRLGILAVVAILAGAYLRVLLRHEQRGRQLLVMTAIASWAPYLDFMILSRPFRDAGLYLVAGGQFARGTVPYITAPMTSRMADLTMLPYLYPPFTLPFFAALSKLPHVLGIAIIVGLCVAAVVVGLRLLGTQWRFMPLLLAWPPLAIGMQVGNVACIAFFLLAATWRYGAAAPLTGVFKAQSGVVALWLVRERRWRSLVIGCAAIAGLILVTLPLTGVVIYGDWIRGLGYFQASTVKLPDIKGMALQRYLPATVAVAVAIGAVVIGLLARGRQGLARLGIAAIVASPTLYVHGLALALPGILMLDSAAVWGVLAVSVWVGWVGLAATLAVLVAGLTRRGLADIAAAGPEAGTRAPVHDPIDSVDVLVHPLGSLDEPWPDAPGSPAG
jgi:hypothetical protein